MELSRAGWKEAFFSQKESLLQERAPRHPWDTKSSSPVQETSTLSNPCQRLHRLQRPQWEGPAARLAFLLSSAVEHAETRLTQSFQKLFCLHRLREDEARQVLGTSGCAPGPALPGRQHTADYPAGFCSHSYKLHTPAHGRHYVGSPRLLTLPLDANRDK